MSLTAEINTLQTRLANAERERSRAEGAFESARAAADNALAELKRDFQVDTTEDAEALLETMRTELAALIEKITAELDRIGVA